MLACRSSTWAWTWNRFMEGSLWSALARGRRGFEGAVRALAAVLGEVAEQRVHVAERGAVDDVAAETLLSDQARVRQLFQVERQRVGRDPQPLGHCTGGESLLARDYQGAEHLQPDGLRQSGQ